MTGVYSKESDKQEMTWVYNQMNWNQHSGKLYNFYYGINTNLGSWRYYWNGLNDLHVAGDLRHSC